MAIEMAIEYRALGKTGLRVSTLGFGGSEIGYQAVAQKAVDKILNTALDAGINVIDTAECYADGEALIGKAIARRRAEVVLMTKCGHAPLGSASERALGYAQPDWEPAMLARSIERSLKNLRTDHVDVIQFHSPPLATLRDGRAIEVIHKARERGQARFVGCSADSDEAVYAVESGAFDTVQISVNIADQEAIELVLPRAAARGMGVIVKRPIANAAWRHGKQPPGDWYTRPYWDRLQALDYDFLRARRRGFGRDRAEIHARHRRRDHCDRRHDAARAHRAKYRARQRRTVASRGVRSDSRSMAPGRAP